MEIEPNIQGLARAESEADKERMQVGLELDFKITNFDPLDHKLGLALVKRNKMESKKESAQAKDKAEAKDKESKQEKGELKEDKKELVAEKED